jgi:hypothetical protein
VAGVAGGHPYLLQTAASALWEVHEDGESDPARRWRQAGDNLYTEAALTLSDTWREWPPGTCKAFTIVALAQTPRLLKQRAFHVERLLRDMRDFAPELRTLKKRGFVTEDETTPGGWRVRPQALLWWLADELVRVVRPEMPFEEWLQKQEWEGLLTRGEKRQLEKAVREVGRLLKDGAATLIEAAAKGVGAAMVKRL